MLGVRIAALRRKEGWSQAQLAQKLGISPSAVGMYEQGRREPPAQLLVALAREFQVTTDYLLTGQPTAADTVDQRRLLAQLVSGRTPSRRAGELTPRELAVLLAAMLTEP
jgi:transcriptional regulator with XRE-family HTH domain